MAAPSRRWTRWTENHTIAVVRFVCFSALIISWIKLEHVQTAVDRTWDFLLQSPFYNSVLFETVFTVFLGSQLMFVFWTLERVPYIAKHYTDRPGPSTAPPFTANAAMAATHILMFGSLDFITPKRYGHVDPIMYELRRGYFHTKRILPPNAPSVRELLWETGVAMLLYDGIFFALHFLMHKVPFLWKNVHKTHHDQAELSVFETDHTTPFERILLVLPGNEALRLVGAHPLSRTLFNIWLMYVLVSNHSTIDLSLGIDRIVPFGLLHSPRDHELHHMKNPLVNYAPVFSHFDRLLVFLEGKKKRHNSRLRRAAVITKTTSAVGDIW